MNPSLEKRSSLLKKSYTEHVKNETKQRLENITFHRELAMDIMWMNGKPVLHIVDTETNY